MTKRRGPENIGMEFREDKKKSRFETVKQRYLELKDIISDETVQEGMDASLRTAINIVITIADTVPGMGDMVSWGADIVKVWARIKYQNQLSKETKRLTDEGKTDEEVSLATLKTVKLSKLDLTPDASLAIAVGTEILEAFSFGAMPTHIFEAGLQLKYDRPRIVNAIKRIRKILADSAQLTKEEEKAIEVFDNNLEK